LFFPAGFYLPFFVRKMGKLKIYSIVMAALIIAVELVQVLTMTGSLDVDDFMLNSVGALIGYLVFTRTPARSLFKLRAWQESDTGQDKNSVILETQRKYNKEIRDMITPYLVFNGDCKDALDFYRSVFHCNEPKVLPYGDLYARRLEDPA